MPEPEIDWEAVLCAAAELQRLVPGSVRVGGAEWAAVAGRCRALAVLIGSTLP